MNSDIFATTNLLTSTSKHYRLEYYYEGASGQIRMVQYAGGAYQTADTYDFRYFNLGNNNTTMNGRDGNETFMPVSCEQNQETWQGTIDIYNPSGTTKQTTFVSSGDGWNLAIPWTIQNRNRLNCKCVCAADASGTVVAVTGLKLYGTATINNAYATLYGMKTA